MDIERQYTNSQSSPELPQATWRGRDILIISAGALFILLVLGGLIAWSFSLDPTQLDRAPVILSVLLTAVEGIALIGSVAILGLRRRGLDWTAAGIHPVSRNWLVQSLVIAAVITPLSGFIAAAIQMALGQPLENPQLEFLIPEGFNWFGFIGMLIMGGFVAPFAEELFFRGVLYKWLRDHIGVWPGILLSSLLFGAMHGEISVAGAAAVLGVILAWVYEKSRSLWPAVIIHVVNNSVKIALLYILVAAGSVIPGL